MLKVAFCVMKICVMKILQMRVLAVFFSFGVFVSFGVFGISLAAHHEAATGQKPGGVAVAGVLDKTPD